MAAGEASRPSSELLEDLLRRVAGGDQRAFERLYDETAATVYGIVLSVVRDPARSEEVAQDVMIELWRLAQRFDAGRGSARGWIATIAHRRAVDIVRSSQSSRHRDEVYGREAVSGGDYDSVAERVLERFEHDSLREALSWLSPLQQEAIVLAYFDGLTYREVAARLDAPLGTIKTRIRDGLGRLRRALGDKHE